jgi:ABC-type bacteriocin/lantibiotic exporter with double-glycine peptidase domain
MGLSAERERPMKQLGFSILLLVVLLLVLSPSFLTTASDGAHTQQLIRINQLDPGQYRSTTEYQTWASSTCSTAAMTEVMNSYGHSYRITDVLAVESHIGAITPQLGLLFEDGIARTVAHFGFKTHAGHAFTLDQVINLANHETPVIVSFPPQRYPYGHLLVVTGGTSSTVLVADSSILNIHSFTRSRFLWYWGGFAAVVRPQEGGQS